MPQWRYMGSKSTGFSYTSGSVSTEPASLLMRLKLTHGGSGVSVDETKIDSWRIAKECG